MIGGLRAGKIVNDGNGLNSSKNNVGNGPQKSTLLPHSRLPAADRCKRISAEQVPGRFSKIAEKNQQWKADFITGLK